MNMAGWLMASLLIILGFYAAEAAGVRGLYDCRFCCAARAVSPIGDRRAPLHVSAPLGDESAAQAGRAVLKGPAARPKASASVIQSVPLLCGKTGKQKENKK